MGFIRVVGASRLQRLDAVLADDARRRPGLLLHPRVRPLREPDRRVGRLAVRRGAGGLFFLRPPGGGGRAEGGELPPRRRRQRGPARVHGLRSKGSFKKKPAMFVNRVDLMEDETLQALIATNGIESDTAENGPRQALKSAS